MDKMQEKINDIYRGYWFDGTINEENGLVRGDEDYRFATFPFIGSNYGKQKKILFVGLDVGADPTGIRTFEQARSAVEDVKLEVHNPHIAGTYMHALYLLREHFNCNWHDLENKDTCQGILKNYQSMLPKENPLSYIALTNIYKIIERDKEDMSTPPDRAYPEWCREFLLQEIKAFEPSIVVFQSKIFAKKEGEIVSILSKELTNTKFYVGPHPSLRGKRKPSDLFTAYEEKS